MATVKKPVKSAVKSAAAPTKPVRGSYTTVKQYLDMLPPDRRATITAVRTVILKNLPKGYQEGIQYGMIGYCIPHSIYPAGYHCDPRQPLPFVGLGSQKNYTALHMMCAYLNPEYHRWFQAAWKRSGKKLDMGKACLRFRKLEDIALDVIGEAIARVPVRDYIAHYEAAIKRAKPSRPAKSARR
ncbi:MAG: DUF1801 domain-containing protein [Phycisphaerales bacterium]|nr:DUF1801 domain-containing protein [Phycisphaerales bacterium]